MACIMHVTGQTKAITYRLAKTVWSLWNTKPGYFLIRQKRQESTWGQLKIKICFLVRTFCLQAVRNSNKKVMFTIGPIITIFFLYVLQRERGERKLGTIYHENPSKRLIVHTQYLFW